MLGVTLAVALLGIAMMARPALAASPTAPQAQAVAAEEEEEWEETCEEEECEEEAWEEVEGEDDGGWAQVFDEESNLDVGPAPAPPVAECPLDTVKPKAVFERDRGKLRLVLHYTADSPTKVGVDFWLKGGKDASGHRSAERRLNKTGVLSLGRHIDRQDQDKSGGGVVIVELKAPAAPSNCRSKVTKRLAVGRTEHTVSAGRLARVR
ncbi:MAG TPA: hypothetical protein VF093_11405 [Solirubrobacterales bacterium]